MPRAEQQWVHDVVAVLVVAAVATLVFWLLPLPAQAQTSALACGLFVG